MTEGTNIKIHLADKPELLRIQGVLMQETGKDVSMADTIHWLVELYQRKVEKALKEAQK